MKRLYKSTKCDVSLTVESLAVTQCEWVQLPYVTPIDVLGGDTQYDDRSAEEAI